MEKLRNLVGAAIDESRRLRGSYQTQLEEWSLLASQRCVECIGGGGKIMIAGNGGSAADSQHFAAELIVRLTSRFDRQALPALALTVDSSVMTAAANDYGYRKIFSRQLEGLGKSGDLFIGISTSGSSANIVDAFTTANEQGLGTIGLFGPNGPAADDLCELPLLVPGDSTMRIQEEHIFALHLLVELIEARYFKK
jgi:D-sedoheptulose 7-phosphate isomerase